jgi:hypothetical protein
MRIKTQLSPTMSFNASKSPATILSESIAAGRVKVKTSLNTMEQPPVTSDGSEKVENNNNASGLLKADEDKDILLLANDPEIFWKCWSKAHTNAAKNCNATKGCSCFEGIGSVM